MIILKSYFNMENKVVEIFNDMEQDYDKIQDLWYSWLFSRLHYLIVRKVTFNWIDKRKVLDIGCGTGYQSFLYSKLGSEVIGIDISERLVSVAIKKNETFNPSEQIELFKPVFKFVKDYNIKINKQITKVLTQKSKPIFELGDAQNIKYQDNYFDHINCCGSTFSFIPDYQKAISEINRTLKSSGTFVLEVEAKNNLDLLWTLLDATVFFGKLEYGTSFSEAINMAFGQIGKHILVDYPFGDINKPVFMNIRLFQKRKLIKEFKKQGLIVDKCYSIHSITNLIPSTKLDTNKPSKITEITFNILSKIEEMIPFSLPSCSLVLIGHKL